MVKLPLRAPLSQMVDRDKHLAIDHQKPVKEADAAILLNSLICLTVLIDMIVVISIIYCLLCNLLLYMVVVLTALDYLLSCDQMIKIINL